MSADAVFVAVILGGVIGAAMGTVKAFHDEDVTNSTLGIGIAFGLIYSLLIFTIVKLILS